jgi:8-oxo-dGTP pyrophosphatase MutT (NUDIX family)
MTHDEETAMKTKILPPYVGVLHITSDGQVMLQMRDDKPGIYDPGVIGTFGGEVEDGETLMQAAIRETQEELDIQLVPDQLSYLCQLWLSEESHGKNQLCHFFVHRGIDPRSVTVYEGQGYVLVSRQSFPNTEPMARFTRQVLTQFFEQE